MTATVTTLATGNISEEVVAQYLQGLGIDPMEPLWYELEHTIRPWIPQFLAAGGSYTKREERGAWSHSCVSHPHPRHLAMVASYGDKSVELRLHKYNAYTSIHLIHPYGTSYFHDCAEWCGVEVHPKYLDIVLCSMLEVPEAKPVPIKHPAVNVTTEHPDVNELTRRPSDLPEGQIWGGMLVL